MLQRSKEEQDADTVMLLIENIYDTQPTLINHLYEMHRLRDWVMWDELNDALYDLDYSRQEEAEFWDKAGPMQTF